MQRPLVCAFAIAIFMAQGALAISLGAGPSVVDFGRLLRGGYAEESIIVSTSGAETLECTVDYGGGMAPWLTATPANFTLPPQSRQEVKISANPPKDAPNGRYDGAITIHAQPKDEKTPDGTGLSISGGIKIITSAEITGIEDIHLIIKNVTADDAALGTPVKVTVMMENPGNIKVSPRIEAQILDNSRNTLIQADYSQTSLAPQTEQTISLALQTKGLLQASYALNVKVWVRDNLVHDQDLSFRLLSEAEMTGEGELEDFIVTPESADAGSLVKLSSTFKNKGDKTLFTRLKAQAYRDNNLFELIADGEETKVRPKETAVLQTYYAPSEPGNYILRGFATYNGANTPTKSAILNVTGANRTWYLLIALLFLISIATLIAYKRISRP